ncbi:exported hypothetical protein [Paraburkholderia piptadeniae]|uniref:Uncharacterized protein n=1 Tax=Paraburkholderia piptadeniae TaxID=1701573 RepID=A0A1N7SEX4_9BURK|nr:exported hypothetical protein [Paraburkholderia piptadeniae]
MYRSIFAACSGFASGRNAASMASANCFGVVLTRPSFFCLPYSYDRRYHTRPAQSHGAEPPVARVTALIPGRCVAAYSPFLLGQPYRKCREVPHPAARWPSAKSRYGKV